MPYPPCFTDISTETAFIQQIDCCFPYRNPLSWRPLATRAAQLSPNAAFMVMHEVCRLPSSVHLTRRERQDILDHLFRRFRHPLVRVLQPVQDAWLDDRQLSVARAIRLMRRVATYRNQYNALALCYFVCNDREGEADRVYSAIVHHWRETDTP